MKILGNSYQEKEPTPTEPVEIKNEAFIQVEVNGEIMQIPLEKLDIKEINEEGVIYGK